MTVVPAVAGSPIESFATDSDESVRVVLAGKLCRLLPQVSQDQLAQVYQVTVKAMEALARDHAVTVRAALASSIKDIECAPPSVVRQLSRDVERAVAEPILHYCVTLADDDLLDIIAADPATWALVAIAGRDRVSARVSTAIAETGDGEAVSALLGNRGAAIPEETLAWLVEDAARNAEWQLRLARRPLLPPRLASRLARFVDQEILDELIFRHDVDPEAALDVVSTTRRRIDWVSRADTARPCENARPRESQAQRARRMHRDGQLDDRAVGDALAWSQIDFVKTALALMIGCHTSVVDGVLQSHSPRGVTALAWRAGLTMRTAILLQAKAARIAPRRLLNAREGYDYPLTEIEMLWHLEFFGVPTGV
ncbi:MAG TPA: DUF2336 domain-containing protein [Azospirillaceae bacterium]|nr:DUF2336 domain-containing protein [Azospirillaceae bacterium]